MIWLKRLIINRKKQFPKGTAFLIVVLPYRYQISLVYEFFEIIFEDGIAGLVGVYFNISDNNSIIEAECAWIIAAHLQGRNLAARSAKKMIRFLSDAGVTTFVAHCDNRNIQSISVAKKLGFELLSDNGCRIYPKNKEQATESCFVLKIRGI